MSVHFRGDTQGNTVSGFFMEDLSLVAE